MSRTNGDQQLRPPRWTNDAPHRGKPKRHRFASLAFNVIGALAIVTGSFLITLKIMDYIDISHKEAREAATKEIRPITWKTTGRASYEIRNGTVIFHGPDYIFNQVDCGSLVSNITFSIFIERAEQANMELTFLSLLGGVVGEPLIQNIEGMTNRTAELRSLTRPGAGKIQAIIYGAREIDTVVFKDALIECKPVE